MIRTTRLPLEDPGFRIDPYPALAEVRQAGPVVADEATGMLLVAGLDDVRAALRHGDLGRVTPEGVPGDGPFARLERASLLSLEGAAHRRLRAPLARAFTPAAGADMADDLAAMARELVAPLRDGEVLDVVDDLAVPLSIGAIAGLLGIPGADADKLVGWSHAMTASYEPDADDAVRAGTDAAAAEFTDWVTGRIAEHRAAPRPGLLGALVDQTGPDGELTDAEVTGLVVLLCNAGHEATVNGLGLGMDALLDHPDQLALLVDGSVDPAAAAEELLRHDSPAQLFHRHVLADGVEVGGVPVPVGATLGLLLGAAGRDPAANPDPDRLDLRRDDPQHVAFGLGLHVCLGAPLARIELTAALAALAEVGPGRGGPAVRRPGFVLRGMAHVPLAA